MSVAPKVKDVMSSRVVTCTPTTTVAEATKKMKDEDVGSIIVLDGKKPVGIMTREDVTNKVAALDMQPSKVHAKDVMSTPVVTATPDESLSEVAKRMNKHGYERMPVAQMGKMIGFVSVRDILRVSPGLLDLLKEHIDEETAPEFKEETNSGECELCGNYNEELKNINDRWVCETCKEEAEEI